MFETLSSNVGWGEAAPLFALIMSIHYAKAVEAQPWLLALIMFGLLLIHWFMHYMLGCGGGTWRSLLRSSCSLTLSMSIAVRVVNNRYYSTVTILISSILCTFDCFAYSRYGNLIKGILNWGSILCLFLALTSGNPEFFYKKEDQDSYDERNWAYLIFCMDLLACPIQDMSLKKGLIWQIVCSACLPIIISQGQMQDGGVRVIQGYALAFVLPSILLTQRSLFWHWMLPPITITTTNNNNIHIRNVKVWYTIACCGSMGICCVSYRPLEKILLATHFALHWLAHVCRGYALLVMNRNGLVGKQPDY